MQLYVYDICICWHIWTQYAICGKDVSAEFYLKCEKWSETLHCEGICMIKDLQLTPSGKRWQKWGGGKREGGKEYIMHQFFKMAGQPLCVFTWWHPGCPHPSVGMLSIFQPSLINPEATPPLSFHLPIWPSWLHCLLPQSNCFHKHMPWILLSGSGVRALRVQVIPQSLPLPLHPAPAPCTLH